MARWFVYIIRTHSGKLYTGITTDLSRRFAEHQGNSKLGAGAKFFSLSAAKEIVFHEFYPNRSLASQREWAIKRLSRQAKLDLIASAVTVQQAK